MHVVVRFSCQNVACARVVRYVASWDTPENASPTSGVPLYLFTSDYTRANPVVSANRRCPRDDSVEVLTSVFVSS